MQKRTLAPQLRGDRAEFFSVTNQSDNTNCLKIESMSPDRQRPDHFWQTSKQLCRTPVSNTSEAVAVGGRNFLARDAHAWWWSPCGCWLCVTFMKTTALCLRTKWSNPCDSFFRSGHVCGDERDKLAPVQLHGGGVVRRRSLKFLSK